MITKVLQCGRGRQKSERVIPHAKNSTVRMGGGREPKGQLLEARKERQGDFPGGPVVKTPHSQCRGPRFDPWSGN